MQIQEGQDRTKDLVEQMDEIEVQNSALRKDLEFKKHDFKNFQNDVSQVFIMTTPYGRRLVSN